jgi:predicted RNA-binding Zn-ribbon protein involved in translation (DUF1610 family)
MSGPAEATSMEELVTVATFEFAPEAEAVLLLLEKNGIDVFLQDVNAASTWGLTNAIGGVKLQVPISQSKLAQELVEEHRENVRQRRLSKDDEDDIVFPCEECGMTISFPARRAGGVETCPHCGKYVDVPE